jgi:hypothetical protein
VFLHVTRVEHLHDFVLRLEFNEGSVRDIDLAGHLWGEVFEPLRDPTFFARVTFNRETGTIEWPNGADLAPEYLLENSRDAEHVA